MVKFGRGANSMRQGHRCFPRLPLILLAIGVLPAATVAADAGDAAATVAGADRAKALRDEATVVRQAAEATHAEAQKACWQRFLVNSCLDEAKQAMRAETARARAMEREARRIERDRKQREIAAREAQRIEEAPRKEAEAAAQAERNRQAREEALRRVAEKQSAPAGRQ